MLKSILFILALLFLHPPCTRRPTAPVLSALATQTVAAQELESYREEMANLIKEIMIQGIQDREVLCAMETVLRHRVVLPEYLDQSYANHPLPIGYGQTISQPFIVAWMTELLELQPGEKVLEIGTGFGLPGGGAG